MEISAALPAHKACILSSPFNQPGFNWLPSLSRFFCEHLTEVPHLSGTWDVIPHRPFSSTFNDLETNFLQEGGEADEDASQGAALQAAEDPSEEAAGAQEGGQAQMGMAGMGANLVSTVRSFLPFVSKADNAQPQPAAGKKPVKVCNGPLKQELVLKPPAVL